MSRKATSSMATEPSICSGGKFHSPPLSPAGSHMHEPNGGQSPCHPAPRRSPEAAGDGHQNQYAHVNGGSHGIWQVEAQGESSSAGQFSYHPQPYMLDPRVNGYLNHLAHVGSLHGRQHRLNVDQASVPRNQRQQFTPEGSEGLENELSLMYNEMMRERRAHRRQQQQNRPPLPPTSNHQPITQQLAPGQQVSMPNRRRGRGPKTPSPYDEKTKR